MNKNLEPIETMEQEAVTAQEQGGEQERVFTQEEVEHIVAQRLACVQAEVEQQLSQARSEGRAEAEQLAQMTELQRREHDAQEAREREERLMRRESELTRRELRAEAVDALASRGLPRELEQLLDYRSAAACTASIDLMEKVFRSAVQKGVDERISQSRAQLPRSGGDARAAMIGRMRAAAGLNND